MNSIPARICELPAGILAEVHRFPAKNRDTVPKAEFPRDVFAADIGEHEYDPTFTNRSARFIRF